MDEGPAAVDPLSIAQDAKLIIDAQKDVGKLDILICGECHEVFHFVEDLKEHKESCAKVIKIKCDDDKSQIWAYCLWKNTYERGNSEGTQSAWTTFKIWSRLTQEERDMWIEAGKTIQSLNKIRTAKLQEIKFKVKEQDPLAITQSDTLTTNEPNIILNKQIVHLNSDVSILPSNKKKKGFRTSPDNDTEEYVVEAILAKRFNSRRRIYEYKVKWENFDVTHSTWEPPEHLQTCQNLVDAFEAKVKKEKLKSKISMTSTPKPIKVPVASSSSFSVNKSEVSFDSLTGRPQRSSKQKAMDQVKQWCGTMSDDTSGSKRGRDSDSDDSMDKRIKMELESDSEDEKPRVVIKKTPKKAEPFVKQLTPSVTISSNGITGKLPDNVLIPDAQGIVRINQKQLPSLESGVYIMSKTAGIIKLDSQTSKIAAAGGQAIVQVAPKIGQTHIKIVKKDSGSPIKRPLQQIRTPTVVQVKTTPPPLQQRRVAPKVLNKSVPSRVTPKVTPNTNLVNKTYQRTSLAKSASFPEPDAGDESDGIPELEFPKELPVPEPEEELAADFVLDPFTGKIAGQEYPERVEKENGETTLDNIVQLAAADITEDDLKPDILIESKLEQSNINDENNDPQGDILKIEAEDVNVPVTKVYHQASSRTPIVKTIYPERTLNKPKGAIIKPGVRQTQMISPSSVGLKTQVRTNNTVKHRIVIPKPKQSPRGPQFEAHPTPVQKTYTSPAMARKVGNTSIYRKPVASYSPKKMATPPMPQPRPQVKRTKTLNPVSPMKAVINMPSLNSDDEITMPALGRPAVETKTEPVDEPQVIAEGTEGAFTLSDGDPPILITGDDGTVYQVAGQNEEGQTILITSGPDGQQQCLLVTGEAIAPDEVAAMQQQQRQQAAETEQHQIQEETSMEGVQEEASTDLSEPLSVRTEPEASDQVVAQVVRAEPPSPGGTHKVVVMLPDGNLMVTQVTPEEYASLELD